MVSFKIPHLGAFKTSHSALLAFFVLFFLWIVSYAQGPEKKHYPLKKDCLESMVYNGEEFLAITSVANASGYSWQWDRYSQSLTCLKSADRVTFVQDNFFCNINGKMVQLAVAPKRFGGQLYLPSNIALELLQSSCDKKLDVQYRLVQQNESKHSISSVFCEKKQNGTLITVNLKDSLLFDITYFYPNLNINFLGGTIDTQKIRKNEACGLIKSFSAVQFKGSAQISMILNRKIEDPVYDYVQDTKTLMLSLRPERQAAKPAVFKPASTLQIETLKTVVIDPGHGGKDPGAIGVGGVKEKTVALNIALKLKEMLKKTEGITVYLTREKDVFIPLRERTQFANDKKADLFISIHADAISGNSHRKESTRGYKVYFLSQAKNEDDKLVAMRENAVIELEDRPQNYSNLQNVLIDLAGNEYLRESQDLCILLDQKFSTGLKKINKLHLGVGQANFWVLNGAYMTSVLIEVGFLSNPVEAKLLADSNFQKNIASSIFDAIIKFKKSYEGGT